MPVIDSVKAAVKALTDALTRPFSGLERESRQSLRIITAAAVASYMNEQRLLRTSNPSRLGMLSDPFDLRC
jgi:hypothetical protein